jgi:catechol 2,3-dioxygenase-like lactoylglutathione lyase family enzyme
MQGETSMSTTPTLGFILFYVSDLEESLQFFTQTVGLRHNPKADTPVFRGFISEEGSVPFGLALVSEEASPEARRPGTIEVYFETDNLGGMRAELVAKGVKPTEIAHRPFGSIFSIPAPDGHLVTMLRPPVR